MPHFWINQLFLPPLKVCDLLRNRCAIYPGIAVRFAPELLCDLTRILQLYLIKSININSELVAAAQKAYEQGTSEMQASGAIRKLCPGHLFTKLFGEMRSHTRFLINLD